MKTIEQRIISKMRGLILLIENYPIEFDMADKYKRETFYKEISKLEAQLKEQEDKPVYDENYLNDCIKRATPNLSKIKDVDKHLDEIRGIEHKDLPTGWPDLPDND